MVRLIFRLYVHQHRAAFEIMEILNRRGLFYHDGTPWSASRVRRVLVCDALTGTQFYNRTHCPLGGRPITIPRERWKAVEVFTPIISPRLFRAARARRLELDGSKGRTSAEMLDDLRRLLRRHGRISGSLVDASPHCGSLATYYRRFGTLTAACDQAGYTVIRQAKGRQADGTMMTPTAMLADLRRLETSHGRVTVPRIEADPEAPSVFTLRRTFGSLPAAYAAAGVRWGRLYPPARQRESRGT